MRILNISLDQKVLEQNSAVQQRILEYGELVDKFTVIVLGNDNQEIVLNQKVKIISLKKSNKFLDLIRLKLNIWKVLRKEKYSLISVQDPYFIGFMCLLVAKFFRIGLEIQVHGWEKFKGLRKILSKYVLRNADSIRVVSQRLKRQLIQDFNIKKDKITVVPVYVKKVISNQQSVISKDDKFIFLTIGRLVPVKNIQMQIEAVNNLRKEFNNIELWIIGNGVLSEKLKVESKKLGVDDIVKFWGYQDNLSKFYQSADCFLLTSDYEGYGMVVIEAASYSLPIIMTDVGCAGEFIKNQENGVIIPIKNQQVLEKTMENLMQDKELRIKLGSNAKNSFLNLPSREENLNLYLKSWQKAIK